jgi:uncharacterized protein CbrC (UPF0167 family)
VDVSYKYRYFRDPHAFSTFREEPQRCGICTRSRPGYDGPFFGAKDLSFVCEECLHDGRLRELDCSTSEGDIIELRGNLALANPGIATDRLATLVADRTDELIYRTPHITTWQDLIWPVHCSDYCRYEKEAGRADFQSLAGAADPKQFFIQHLAPADRGTDLDDLWQSIREDSPVDNSIAYNTTVYLFSCLICAAAVVMWDCD